MPPPRYPSELSDEEWTILEPLLSRVQRRGRPPEWPARRVADAVFYLLRAHFKTCQPPLTLRTPTGQPRLPTGPLGLAAAVSVAREAVLKRALRNCFAKVSKLLS